MEEMNIIERANKILTFRKYIREECRKKGLEYPSDERLAEYLACGFDYNVQECMNAYENKIGVFKDPFNDFKTALNKITWDNKPTEAEMREFFDKNGNDVSGFIRERTINSYKGLEKDTLLATLEFNDTTLVALWNTFIEESAKYGADSYIYDLKCQEDINFIHDNFPKDKIAELTRIIRNGKMHNKEVRFFQWHNLNDDKFHVFDDIKGTIVAYWSEIFERIMIYPSLYELGGYFSEIFWVECAKHLGFKVDLYKAELNAIEK